MDVVVGGLVLSPLAAGLVSWLFNAIWQRGTKKELARLEARLQVQGEAFRLAHSPRVEAALSLWAAFCVFERCLGSVVGEGMRVLRPPAELTVPEQSKWMDEEEKRQRLLERQALGEAWRRLIEAQDRAECLLTEELAAAFAQLLGFLAGAHKAHWIGSRHTGYPDDMAIEKVSTQLELAKEARPKVATAIRALIAGQLEATPGLLGRR